jgi:hypothetical protein
MERMRPLLRPHSRLQSQEALRRISVLRTRHQSSGHRKVASSIFGCQWALVLVAAGVLSACHRPSDAGRGITLRHEIDPSPAHQGDALLSFQLFDAQASPVSHAHVSIEGDMTHPGMAPTFSDAQETAPGSYQAHVNFTMGGDWVLLLHVTLADGRRFERQIDVKGVETR